MKNIMKKLTALALCGAMVATTFAGCGAKKNSASGETADFGRWIFTDDGAGSYYDSYDQNMVVQWVNNQSWDTQNGGISSDGNGSKLKLSFTTPVAGSEQDNFNTMVATGEYPEIIDLVAASDTPKSFYENGTLIEITDYVEKYMPNYTKYLDENPQFKPFVSTTDEEGNTHYYSISCLSDGNRDPWEGYQYRRDWVVKYAVPSEYVWDWDSSYVKEKGHPEVTPLAAAQSSGNMNGWKKNEVTSFVSQGGENPNETYTDNVIFPSGKTDPYTVSDWEWMFEAFKKAIDTRGNSENASAYCISLWYTGWMLNNVLSCFGGTNGAYYNDNGTVEFSGTTDNFKNYLVAMSNWYDHGWLDRSFETRTSDMFYAINTNGVYQGMVGMWDGMASTIGDSIRTTCADSQDQKDAFVMGCSLPLNDTYGTKDQMFVEPDEMFRSSKITSQIGFTSKCKDKSEEEMATLFTYLDWTYTMEGAETLQLGLSQEQYDSMSFSPDNYKDHGITCAYSKEKGEDGKTLYQSKLDSSDSFGSAAVGLRMAVGIEMAGNEEYTIDRGYDMVFANAIANWSLYDNSAAVTEYKKLMTEDEITTINELGGDASDYMHRQVPVLIKNKVKGWDSYVKALQAMNLDQGVEIYQKYIDKAK